MPNPTPNSQLAAILTTFAQQNGGTSGQPYQTIMQALNNSSALTNELNADALNGTLTSIAPEAPVSGNGGQFVPNPNVNGGPGGGTIFLPETKVPHSFCRGTGGPFNDL